MTNLKSFELSIKLASRDQKNYHEEKNFKKTVSVLRTKN